MSLRKMLYKTQRTMGDVDAAQRHRLPRRLLRRALTRTIMRGWK